MLGIIGGVGPDATARLYQTLMRLSASEAEGALPRLLLYNLAMTPRIENAYLSGCINAASPERIDAQELLSEAMICCQRSGVECIIMPCNTLQDELAALCKARRISHVNMIDETAAAVVAANARRILVLGTASTCQEDLYGKRLLQHQVTCVYPQADAQRAIEHFIRQILDFHHAQELPPSFLQLVRELGSECDGVLVACTDLSGKLSQAQFHKPVFDSLECLAQAAARWIRGQRSARGR